MQNNGHSSPSSSSVFGLDSTRLDSRLEDRLKTEDRRRRGLVFHRDVANLIEAIINGLHFSYPEARQAVLVWGAERVEGALVKTLWEVQDGQNIKRPKGWFLATLKGGKEWSSEDLQLHRDWLSLQEEERIMKSNDVTAKRLLLERRQSNAANDACAATGQEDAASETTR